MRYRTVNLVSTLQLLTSAEAERLRIFHQVFKELLDGSLYTAPLEDPKTILDIGTGTGDWAIDMAEYASALLVFCNEWLIA